MKNQFQGDDLRLKNRDEIRKAKKKEENLKLKNTIKSKRRHILQKKKHAYEIKRELHNRYNYKGRTRSKMLVVK